MPLAVAHTGAPATAVVGERQAAAGAQQLVNDVEAEELAGAGRDVADGVVADAGVEVAGDAHQQPMTLPDPPKSPIGLISPEDKGKKTSSQAKRNT